MLQTQPAQNKATIWWLLPLLALTLGVRMIILKYAEVPSKDCDIFMRMAEAATAGDWHTFFHGHPFHPLYPYLMSKLAWIADSPLTVGRWISMFFGTLALVPLFFLTARIFNYRIATATGVFFAFQPYLVGSATDVLSDSVYVCLFLFSAWTAYEALREKSRRFLLAFSGLFAGLAYLARPEGAGIVAFLCLWLMVSLFRKEPGANRFAFFKKEFASAAFACIFVVGGFIAVALPYMLEINGFTRKKPVWEFFGVKPLVTAALETPTAYASDPVMNALTANVEAPASAISPREQNRLVERSRYQNNIPRSAIAAANQFIIAYHYPLAVFWLIGLVIVWRPEWRKNMGVWFLLLLSLAYLFVAFRLLVSAGYCSKRHLFSSVVLMLPLGGVGALVCADALHRGLNRLGLFARFEMSSTLAKLRQLFHLPAPFNYARLATVLVLSVAVLATVPKTLKSSQGGWVITVVDFIKGQQPVGSKPKIISRDPRLAIMVPGVNLWHNLPDEQHLEQALQPGTWIVLDLVPEDREQAEEWLRDKLEKRGLKPLPKNMKAIIYYVPEETTVNPPSKK